MIIEGNLEGLVGPTHNYAGLSAGNVASESHKGARSNPRLAALQGLEKSRLLMRLGVRQMVMPPHPRPHLPWLSALGVSGIREAAKHAPHLLPYAYSAAGMWVANAATVAPSADTPGGYVQLTPANMAATPHRAMEAEFAARALRRLFPKFTHHAPLPASPLLGDEGAANHMRVGGVHVFVYGREGASFMQRTGKYPARQTLAASEAVARLHGLTEKNTLFVRQNPRAIDAGVFHNDVIATSCENLLLYHEAAFAGGDAPVKLLKRLAPDLCAIKISNRRFSLQDAVKTYLFNSQIARIPGGGMVMLAPQECERHAKARGIIESLDMQAYFMPLRESMKNGGGPACLRLRLPLEETEWKQVHKGAVLTEALAGALEAWVKKHYRDRLDPKDLRDPALAEESFAALSALEKILQLPGLYDGY